MTQSKVNTADYASLIGRTVKTLNLVCVLLILPVTGGKIRIGGPTVRAFSMIAIAVALVSAPAMAGGKGGGGHASSGPRPQENLSLNYGKVNQTYTAQPRDAATGQASGKRQHKPISVVKEFGAASPMLRGNSSNDRKGGRYLAQ